MAGFVYPMVAFFFNKNSSKYSFPFRASNVVHFYSCKGILETRHVFQTLCSDFIAALGRVRVAARGAQGTLSERHDNTVSCESRRVALCSYSNAACMHGTGIHVGFCFL